MFLHLCLVRAVGHLVLPRPPLGLHARDETTLAQSGQRLEDVLTLVHYLWALAPRPLWQSWLSRRISSSKYVPKPIYIRALFDYCYPGEVAPRRPEQAANRQ